MFIYLIKTGLSSIQGVKNVFLLNKIGYKCFNPKTRKTIVSMDITFFGKSTFFSKKFSSGGEHRRRRKFLGCYFQSLPKTVDCITKHIPQNEFFNKKKIAIPNVVFETGDTKTILPNTSETATGGEILPSVLKKQDRELFTYSRRNHTSSKRPTIPLAQGQPDTLSEESERNTSTLDTSSHNLVPNHDEISEPTIDLMPDVNSNDHDIPIAIRKRKTLLYFSSYVQISILW